MNSSLALVAAALLQPGAPSQDGLTLFQPSNGTTTYLVDDAGAVVHTWPGAIAPGLAVYLLPGGDLMRTLQLKSGAPGTGGGFERLSYAGDLKWRFALEHEALTPHHDIEVLPNGNVMMIVWEEVGSALAISRGRDPATAGPSFAPDAIIEIAQTGDATGEIVWEWHALDHVVQDFDPGLPSFGVVADHAELIDINHGSSGDWMHTNGIDFHPRLDQILLTVPRFDEVWIIDHSTTTEEAASHSGGRSGKGGDLLYRHGNPQTYGHGTEADRVFHFIHDAQWIEEGRPGAGHLILFNNGVERPTGDWSSVEEWAPPMDAAGAYSRAPGAAFGPTSFAWTYSDPGHLFAPFMGGVERLENGNTLICDSTSGTLIEVNAMGDTVWSYVNPFGVPRWIFKARRVSDCDRNGICDAAETRLDAVATLRSPRVSAPSSPRPYPPHIERHD